MKYDAVFFDLDGTIIETIPLWQRAYLETLQEFGIKMNVDDFMSKIYVTSQPLIEALAEQGVVDAPTVQKFRAQRDQKYCEILREEVKWIQGAEQTLRSAKKKAPLGLITGSWRPYVEATDARLNLSKYFEVIVTANEMEQGKPHPSGLLIAAKNLQVNPVNCIYIGDMPFDIAAANAAGMTSCLLWGKDTPVGADGGAQIVCKDLEEVKERILT